MKFVVFLLILLSVQQVQAGARTLENIDDLERLSQQVPKIVFLSATQNIAVFCQVNGFRDVNDKPSSDGTSGAKPTVSPGWESSFYATYDYRYASFLSYFDQSMEGKTVHDISEPQKTKALQAAFDIIEKNPGALDKDTIDSFDGEESDLEDYAPDQAKDFSLITAKATYLCTDLTAGHLKACVDGVRRLEKKAHPVEGINMPSLWREVVDDPIYMKVFKKVSLSILAQIKDQAVPKARFFEEFKAAFLKESGNIKKAEDYAWKTEALLATGGANAYRRTEFMGRPIPEMDDLLYVLANGSLVLDRLSARNGFLYTSPKEVSNTCDYGKNYHFWMTAYFAREEMKVTGNAEGAATAAYTIEKAYQFASTTSGRDPSRAYTDPTFSNNNNNMRLDLSLSAVGAWYGVDSLSAAPKTLNQKQVDDGVRKTFADSKRRPLQKMTADDFSMAMNIEDFSLKKPLKQLTILGLYYDWRRIINPDESFNYYQKQMGY